MPAPSKMARVMRSEGVWLFSRSPAAILAAIATIVIVVGALLAPWIAPSNPYDLATFSLIDGLLPPVWEEGGDPRFVLGTDDQGRDMLSSILYGARLSLSIAAMAMAVALVLGVGVGLAAGYFGGHLDAIVMRIADVQLALPAILTALLIDGISRGLLPRDLHDDLRIAVITLAIALSLWVNFARTARASVFVERNKDYVQAAIMMGLHPLRIMLRHILPNVVGPLLVIATVDLASAILLEATLSFLGVGLPADSPSLGTLIRIGMQYLLSGEWWILWIPTVFLVVLVVAINLLGDFLRDLFNPGDALMLRVEGLSVQFRDRFGATMAVEDLSLSVAKGEIHGLVGESGAGKSTIGAAIMGLLPAAGEITSGTLMLGDTDLRHLSPIAAHRLRGKRISMIFQDPQTSLNPLMTVEAQLIETILAHETMSLDAARARAIALLEEIGIANAPVRIRAWPHQFSGGMRQRVVIALALCTNPELIIADEPTTALDVAVQAQVLDLIRSLADTRGVGFILITHDIGVIAQVADRVTVLRAGRVMEQGPTPRVLGQPDHPYTQALMAAVPPLNRRLDRFRLPRVAGEQEAPAQANKAREAEDWLMQGAMGGRSNGLGPALDLSGITVRFRSERRGLFGPREDFTALDEVSLSVRPGTVMGLVGESGSGKSTIAKVIAALVQPAAGEMRLDGAILPLMRTRRRADPSRRLVQMVFQDPYSSLNSRLRVVDILTEPLWLYGLEPDAGRRDRLARAMLALVGLDTTAADRYPHQFSGGQRQRIAVARALLSRPGLLLCDEPTSALDVSIQAQILNLLKDMQARFGLTTLFISHNLAVVRQMSDDIAVLKDGKLVETGPSEAFFARPRAAYSRDLLAQTPTVRFAAPAA